jgi:hypothetical protein
MLTMPVSFILKLEPTNLAARNYVGTRSSTLLLSPLLLPLASTKYVCLPLEWIRSLARFYLEPLPQL